MTRPFAEIFTDAVSAANAPGDRRLTAIKFLTDLADVEEGHGHGGALEMIAAATVAQPFIAFLLSSPPASPGPVDTDRILAALQTLTTQVQGLETKMTALSDAVATLTADDTALATEVDALIAVVQATGPAALAALQASLDASNADAATAAAALAAVDASVKDSTAKALAALPTPAPAPTPAPDAPVI